MSGAFFYSQLITAPPTATIPVAKTTFKTVVPTVIQKVPKKARTFPAEPWTASFVPKKKSANGLVAIWKMRQMTAI